MDNKVNEIYANRIKEMRYEMGLSQQELSDLLKKELNSSNAYSREAISMMENGKKITVLPYKRLIKAMERVKNNYEKK